MLSIFKTDAYKLHHREQYPTGTQAVYSNLSPRGMKYFSEKYYQIDETVNTSDYNSIMVYGAEYIIKKLHEEWKNNFFRVPWYQIEGDIELFQSLNSDIDIRKNTTAYKELHDYGKLPLEFRYINDYVLINEGTPIITVYNTDDRFYWLVNYIETWLSCEYWPILTAANIARAYHDLGKYYAEKTCDTTYHIPFQFHDFSQRGINGTEGAIKTGLGHLAFFKGSDNLPAIVEANKYFNNFNASSIPATEHSVMCAGGKDDELKTYERLLTIYPSGYLSIVSDTWDLWNVIENILPKLKDRIMKRDGKLVIRPDSGNPADIICGTKNGKGETPEEIGVLQLLANEFGTTTNHKGYKVLSEKIGIIYGDSITFEIATDIFNRMEKMGYASSNVVFGIGSFTYQYNTRDTFQMAVKATMVKINNKWVAIKKEPITDKAKTSLTGYIIVEKDGVAISGLDFGEENDNNILRIYKEEDIEND